MFLDKNILTSTYVTTQTYKTLENVVIGIIIESNLYEQC